MSESRDPRLLTSGKRSGGWLQRALVVSVGAALAIVAFFFLAAALIAGAFLALAIGVRWWRLMRRVRARARAAEALEGQYTVVEPAAVEERTRER